MSLLYAEAKLPVRLEGMEHVGKKCQEARELMGLTPAKLGKLVGVSYNAVKSWEKMGDMGAARLLQLAQVTGHPLSFFIGPEVRELEEVAGLSALEQELLARWRALKEARQADEAEQRKTLDLLDLTVEGEGRHLVEVYQAIGEDARRQLRAEAAKLRVLAGK